jgi:hypothetical protein
MGKRLPPDQLALYKRIDEILWEDWDPIGITGSEGARNEYQNYLPGVFALALGRCDVDEIADRLHYLERELMGLPGSRDHCVWVAKRIRDERIKLIGPV